MAWNQEAPLAARLSAQQEHEQQMWWRRQERGQELLRKGLLEGFGEAKISFFQGAGVTTIADLAAIDVDHMANHYFFFGGRGSKKFIAKWKNVAREYQEQPDEDLPPLLGLRDARLLRDATERFESLVVAN